MVEEVHQTFSKDKIKSNQSGIFVTHGRANNLALAMPSPVAISKRSVCARVEVLHLNFFYSGVVFSILRLFEPVLPQAVQLGIFFS